MWCHGACHTLDLLLLLLVVTGDLLDLGTAVLLLVLVLIYLKSRA